MRKCWRLRYEATSEFARARTGTAAFTVGVAIRFLKAATAPAKR